jgi:hypothetical protein
MYLHLHCFIRPCKLYKYIYFYTYKIVNEYYTLTLAQSVNKFHYGICIYIKYKSQTIYTHKIGPNMLSTLKIMNFENVYLIKNIYFLCDKENGCVLYMLFDQFVVKKI